MASAKFEVEKFDGQNSFSLWRIKMRALLRQQGLAKILEPSEERIGIKAIEEIAELAELEEKAHSAILLSLSDGVLREVADEETAAGLWKKLESLYMKKSLTNRLYLKQRLYTLKMKEGQQVVQGNLAPDQHHNSHHRHLSKFRPSKLFVFGDSYADTGNAEKSWPSWNSPYGITFPGKPAGRFSDGNVLTDYVAEFVGVRSPITYKRARRTYGIPLFRYGINFAHGGMGVFRTLYPGPNMTTQIDFFHRLITDNMFTITDLHSSLALVTLSGNDYAYIANYGSAQGLQSFVPKVVNQLIVNLKRIHGLGVKKVAVTALQPLGCLPENTAMSSFRQCNATPNSIVNFHNLLLEQAVAKLNNETKDSAFLILDLYASFMSVFDNNGKNPGSRKFENPLKPCCFGTSSKYRCGSVDKSGAKKYTLCEDPKSAFFWDNSHPTQEGWRAVYSALQPNLQQLF